MLDSVIACCGPAAVPGELWARCNFDPPLIAMLALLAFVIGSGRSSSAHRGRIDALWRSGFG